METTWPHQLRAVGLRVTRPRLSVLDVLAAHPHADAESIVTGARAQHPSLSPQAV
jgi:Fur family ferric uptake transcriptional regulator